MTGVERIDRLIDGWGALGDRGRDAALRAAEGSLADWRAARRTARGAAAPRAGAGGSVAGRVVLAAAGGEKAAGGFA